MTTLKDRRTPALERGDAALWQCDYCGALLETMGTLHAADQTRTRKPSGPCPSCHRDQGWRRQQHSWSDR